MIPLPLLFHISKSGLPLSNLDSDSPLKILYFIFVGFNFCLLETADCLVLLKLLFIYSCIYLYLFPFFENLISLLFQFRELCLQLVKFGLQFEILLLVIVFVDDNYLLGHFSCVFLCFLNADCIIFENRTIKKHLFAFFFIHIVMVCVLCANNLFI